MSDNYSPSNTSSNTTSLSKINLYMNTIVFSFVTGVFVIVLLALLIRGGQSGTMTKYAPLIITLQVGLVCVVIFALYKVLVFESKMNKYNKRRLDGSKRTQLVSCPDYWTLNEDGKGKRHCERYYSIPGGFITMPGKSQHVDLNKFDMQPMKETCKALSQPDLKNTPWSALSAECDAFAYN